MDPASAIALEAIISTVTEQVFKTVATTAAPKVRAWLGREPARLAFQTALLRAVNRFAERHPTWASSLLDETFFTDEAVTRELARFFTRHETPNVDALAPHLAQQPCATLYPLWAETLPLLARRTRSDLLSDLQALQEVVFALGGEAAAVETARAIQDVGRWWP